MAEMVEAVDNEEEEEDANAIKTRFLDPSKHRHILVATTRTSYESVPIGPWTVTLVFLSQSRNDASPEEASISGGDRRPNNLDRVVRASSLEDLHQELDLSAFDAVILDPTMSWMRLFVADPVYLLVLQRALRLHGELLASAPLTESNVAFALLRCTGWENVKILDKKYDTSGVFVFARKGFSSEDVVDFTTRDVSDADSPSSPASVAKGDTATSPTSIRTEGSSAKDGDVDVDIASAREALKGTIAEIINSVMDDSSGNSRPSHSEL